MIYFSKHPLGGSGRVTLFFLFCFFWGGGTDFGENGGTAHFDQEWGNITFFFFHIFGNGGGREMNQIFRKISQVRILDYLNWAEISLAGY